MRGRITLESFDFRGLPIRYEHTGQGEPVIMLHNGGSSHAIWAEVANRLAGKYEIFALDLLGFGNSAKPGAGYTLDNYVAMLEEFVSSRALEKVALVGNCMGSAISLAFTDRHPDKVKALVLCNPLTESTFLGGWLGPFLWIRERMPGINRQVYRLLGQLEAHQRHRLGRHSVPAGAARPCPEAPSQPRTLRLLRGHRPGGVAARGARRPGELLGHRQPRTAAGVPSHLHHLGAEEQDGLAQGGTSPGFGPAPRTPGTATRLRPPADAGAAG